MSFILTSQLECVKGYKEFKCQPVILFYMLKIFNAVWLEELYVFIFKV